MSNSLMKNAMFNTAYKALSVIFPLVSVSYASRVLGADGIGNVSSSQNIVTYFTMFASLGIPTYGVRTIAKLREDENNSCDANFTELFLINFLSTVLCALSYFILINTFAEFDELRELYIVFGSLIIFNIFNIEWIYQGFEEYRYIAIRSFRIKIVSLVLLVLTVKTKEDIIIYSLIVCFGTVGNYILNIINLKKYVYFTFENLQFTRHFKPIFILFCSVISIELYSLVDVTMLTRMTNAECVGYYSNSAKMVKILANTFTAFGAVLLPRLSLYYAQDQHDEIKKIINKFINLIMFIAIPSCIGCILIADKIVLILFGKDFIPATTTLQLLTPLIVLKPLSAGIFGQILLTTNQDKKYFRCVCLGAIGNIILNSILIILWKQNGAAVGSVITECIVSGTMIFSCRKIAHGAVDYKFLFSVILSAIGMVIVIYSTKWMIKDMPSVYAMILQIIVGALAYALGLILTKNKMSFKIIIKTQELLKKVKMVD